MTACLLMMAAAAVAWPVRPALQRRIDKLAAADRLINKGRTRGWLVPRFDGVAVRWGTAGIGIGTWCAASAALGVSAAVITALALSGVGRLQRRRDQIRQEDADLRGLTILETELECGVRLEEAMAAAERSRQPISHTATQVVDTRRDRVWQNVTASADVAQRSGVPTARVVAAAKEDLLAQVERRRAMDAATAGARASAALLAVLPLLGLVLGAELGASPLALLLTSSIGHLMLLIGIGFLASGVLLARLVLDQVGDDKHLEGLPLALDLTAAALRSGQPVEGALKMASENSSAQWGPRLADVAMMLELGAAPQTAWSQLSAAMPQRRRGLQEAREAVASLTQIASRSAYSGAALANSLGEMASRLRQQAQTRVAARAARCATLIVAPLGLCFLPAFLCLGIAPTILSAIHGTLHNTG